MATTKLSSTGLKNSLKKYKLEDSIIEYVWNGFDAGATRIDINEKSNEIGGVISITIKDNGSGIDRNLLENKFTYVYESEKKNSSLQDVTTKGKKGIGRYSFYSIARSATWQTTYKNQEGKNYKYNITINANDLINYNPDKEILTSEQTGTIVELYLNDGLSSKNIEEELKIAYAWYLQLYKEKEIYFNNVKLDCSNMLYQTYSKNGDKDGVYYDLTVCVWNHKLNDEYSKYYYLNENKEVLYKENTTLNNKGDNFYHSVFIKSNLFDANFSFNSQLGDDNLIKIKTKQSKEFKWIKKECDAFLATIRKPFIKDYAKKFIEKLKSKNIYPTFDSKNPIDKFKEKQLDELIANVYYFVPKVFTSLNTLQQKTLIKMFELIQQSGETNNLFKIIEEVVDLTSEERCDMANLLEKAELSNIIEMQKLVVDRLQAINDFEHLVFDEGRYVNEIDHIQKFVEKHYWMFGEQYHLATAEEPNFEEALRRFLNIASDVYYKKGEIKINDENKNKQMDIFAIQQIPNGNIKKCIVVELKRPSKILTSSELSQIKTYFNTIIKEDRFNAGNIEWEFILVGNDYNYEIENEIKNASNHGLPSLVYMVNNCKIYVKKWSEIFTDLRLNMNFLSDKLKLDNTKLEDRGDLTSTEIVLSQDINTAKMQVNNY